MVEYQGQLRLHDFKCDWELKKRKAKGFCNSIMVLDIEVTSAWLKDGEVVGYEIGHDAEYWNDLEPLALPYIWQFSCDGEVYYGREWRDFLHVLDDLPTNVECIIWVHNLSYEFQFLCDLLHWKSIFARNRHKPMKCVSEEYPNVEFRCSYFLTRLSLATWGTQLGVLKMVGDLDYEPVRTPLTPLTDKEMGYCEQDCLVVEAGIKQYIAKYGNLRSIPLTQTGTVRLEAKKRLFSDRKYISFIKKLIPRTAREYKIQQRIFAGGYAHANYWYSGETISGLIEHYDIASSYPTRMVCEMYPMSPWFYTAKHKMPPDERFETHAYIAHVRFRRLSSTSFNTYLQSSKCSVKRCPYKCENCPKSCDWKLVQFDNGRIRKAWEVDTWITEQDWLTIRNNYKWDSIEVLQLYESRKDYLPKQLIEYILELYANKTELKGIKEKEELYLQSKQYINSIFGMMVTAIVQSDVELIDDEWFVKPLTEDLVNEKFKKMREPRDRKYFLSYSWGCWVTAYARRTLWKCIEAVDDDVLYCDTDSIFVRGHHDFSWYNEEVTEKLKKVCRHYDIPFEKTRPKTPSGVSKPLGVLDKEEDCIQFKTLGAKRYVERRADGKLYLTVSGINKEAVEMLENDIDNFRDGFDFDKDSVVRDRVIYHTNPYNQITEPCVKKKISTYLTDMPIVTYPDGYVSTYRHGINMRRTGYQLTMTDEYKTLIDYFNKDSFTIPEQFEVHMRGHFSVDLDV